jgi:hypothetical protein
MKRQNIKLTMWTSLFMYSTVAALLTIAAVRAFAGPNPGYEECLTRPDQISTVHCASDCAGSINVNHCHRVAWIGCNDCVAGESTCPNPPPNPACETRTDTAQCYPSATGVCLCSSNWVLGALKDANSGC